jgi:hypothetical protein
MTAVNDRHIFTSERAPHVDKINLALGSRWGFTPRLTGQLTVGRNVILTWL